MSLRAFTVAFTSASALLSIAAHPAAAGRAAVELGGGIDFTALGSYDVGAALGGDAQRSDLGPGTLGVFVAAGLPVSDTVTVGAEGGLAVGGLVRTDERYFGMRDEIGSTLTVWAHARAGFSLSPRLHLGGAVGVERLSEATGSGSVHLDALVAGPWVAVPLGHGFSAEVHADVNVPYRASIGDDRRGDPTGTFFSAGVRVAYAYGFGGR